MAVCNYLAKRDDVGIVPYERIYVPYGRCSSYTSSATGGARKRLPLKGKA